MSLLTPPLNFEYAKIIIDNHGITVVKHKSIEFSDIFANVSITFDADSGLYQVNGNYTHSGYYYDNFLDDDYYHKEIDKIDKKFIEIVQINVKPKRKFFTSWFEDLPVQYKDEKRIKKGYVHFDKTWWTPKKYQTNNILIKH